MPEFAQIDSEQDDIILRFNRKLVDQATLSRLVNLLEIASLRTKSAITLEQADAIAEEIDAAVWEQVKEKYRK